MLCKECQQQKSKEDFYASNSTRCKACVCAAVKLNRSANEDYYRVFDRNRSMNPDRVAARAAYAKTPAYQISHSASVARWSSKYPGRRKANVALNNAIRDGRLTPWPVCAVPECDSNPEGHHPDYSRPLEVVWLCSSHHRSAHAIAANDPSMEIAVAN